MKSLQVFVHLTECLNFLHQTHNYCNSLLYFVSEDCFLIQVEQSLHIFTPTFSFSLSSSLIYLFILLVLSHLTNPFLSHLDPMASCGCHSFYRCLFFTANNVRFLYPCCWCSRLHPPHPSYFLCTALFKKDNWFSGNISNIDHQPLLLAHAQPTDLSHLIFFFDISNHPAEHNSDSRSLLKVESTLCVDGFQLSSIYFEQWLETFQIQP